MKGQASGPANGAAGGSAVAAGQSATAAAASATRGGGGGAASAAAVAARCRCRARSLWPLWYAASALGAQVFLVYQGGQRYATFRDLPWRDAPPSAALAASLNAQMALLVASCCCLAGAVIALFTTPGCDGYAAAGLKIGRDRLRREMAPRAPGTRGAGLIAARGLVPLGQALHVAASFCLLLAPVFSEAEAVKGTTLAVNGETDLDLLEAKQLFFNVSLGDGSIAASSAYSPGLLLELVNFAYALSAYSVAYASTFWFTSRQFSVIFATQLLGAGLLHCLSFSGWRLQLLLLAVPSGGSDALAPTAGGAVSGSDFILQPASLTGLYVLGNVSLFLSSSAVFHYGYALCREAILSTLKKFYRYAPGCGGGGGATAYAPHVAASVAIAVVGASFGPILYDHVVAYRRQSGSGGRLLMAHLLCGVVYMLLWIMLWFAFTVKQSWGFRVHEAVVKRHAVMLNRHRVFVRQQAASGGGGDDDLDDTPSSASSASGAAAAAATVAIAAASAGTGDAYRGGGGSGSIRSVDSLSSSASVSTTNDGGSDSSYRRPPNGILSQKVKQRRRQAEQKVKFQDVTKVLIETNLDLDLDTIPEDRASEDGCPPSAGGARRLVEFPQVGPPQPPPNGAAVAPPASAAAARNGVQYFNAPAATFAAPEPFAARPNGVGGISKDGGDDFAILRVNGLVSGAGYGGGQAGGPASPGGNGNALASFADNVLSRRSVPQRERGGSSSCFASESRSGRDSAIFSIASSLESSDCDAPGRMPSGLGQLDSAV